MKAAFTPGSTFAGYRVDSLAGRGGMGVVYRATDLSLERPVALKLIAPELAEDKRFRERFLREPKLAASIDHPNVIPIYEAGEHDGQLYLAMRFVDGQDLKTILQRDGKLAPQRALDLLGQVAGALDAAHRRALVHRDVKPANVLLDEDDHVYLTDFGITKQLGGTSTDTDRVVGTLDYLAPEQIRGDPVDGRTDCYALGCVLYECLSGKAPFRRATEAETLWAHMQEEPASLRGHPKLDPVLRKALAKDREDRYGSCAELIDAAAVALGLEHARRPRRPALPARRRHGRLLLAGGLLLAVATVAAALAGPGRRRGGQGAAAGQRRGGHRGRRRRAGVLHQDADGPRHPRRGRGRGLDAEPRRADGHAHRPRQQEGRRAHQAARRPGSTSPRARAPSGCGRARASRASTRAPAG